MDSRNANRNADKWWATYHTVIGGHSTLEAKPLCKFAREAADETHGHLAACEEKDLDAAMDYSLALSAAIGNPEAKAKLKKKREGRDDQPSTHVIDVELLDKVERLLLSIKDEAESMKAGTAVAFREHMIRVATRRLADFRALRPEKKP